LPGLSNTIVQGFYQVEGRTMENSFHFFLPWVNLLSWCVRHDQISGDNPAQFQIEFQPSGG
jgi:hypothetical protein